MSILEVGFAISVLSVVITALGWLAAGAFRMICRDAAWRERIWAIAFYLPALPFALSIVALLTPLTTIDGPDVAVLRLRPGLSAAAHRVTSPDTISDFRFDGEQVASAFFVLAGLLLIARLAWLLVKAFRLHQIARSSVVATPQTRDTVDRIAAAMGVKPPVVHAHRASDAMLLGCFRPLLILPEGLMETSSAEAMIRHELAHLKRADHRSIWLEEVALATMAFNPLLALLRDGRAAAREEACDALALTNASDPERRAYAKTLVQAFRDQLEKPRLQLALTFTGSPRRNAMNRLNAILNPVPAAGRTPKVVAAALCMTIMSVAGFGTVAIASQRDGNQPTQTTGQGSVDPSAQAATETATRRAMSTLTPAQLARYDHPSAQQYQAICTSQQPGDEGFCSGVLFAMLPLATDPDPDFCPPMMDGDVDLSAVSARGREVIATLSTRGVGSANDLALIALRQAFPCRASGQSASASLTMEPGSVARRVG